MNILRTFELERLRSLIKGGESVCDILEPGDVIVHNTNGTYYVRSESPYDESYFALSFNTDETDPGVFFDSLGFVLRESGHDDLVLIRLEKWPRKMRIIAARA